MIRPAKAGLYENVPFDVYLSWEAVSRTELVKIADSPRVLKDYREHGFGDLTDAIKRGSGGDILLFEGSAALAKAFAGLPRRMDELPDNFVEAPEDYAPTRLEKNGGHKGWKKEQEDAGRVIVPPSAWTAGGLKVNTTPHTEWKKAVRAAGRDVVSADIWREMHECAEAARANPHARVYLGLGDDGKPAPGHIWQPSILWQDNKTGLWCKCRPDNMRIEGDVATLGDLKIPEVDVRPNDMGGNYTRHIFQTKLDWQAGFYCRGVREATGLICDAFNLIAVHGKGRIHRVEHHCIDDTDADLDRDFLGSLTTGEAEIMAQLVLLEQCERLNWWPKESGQSHKASRPNYMRR